MRTLDHLYSWIQARLAQHSAEVAAFWALPVLALALILLARQFMRLLPWALSLIVVVSTALFEVAAFVWLSIDFAISWIHRAVHRKPPAPLYALGDMLTTALARIRENTKQRARPTTPDAPWLVTMGMALALIVWWSETYCGRQPGSACIKPSVLWVNALDAWIQSVARRW